MRHFRHIVGLLFFLSTSAYSLLAQKPKLTDAERMDLAGPVKSVSLITTKTDVAWQQPGGPTFLGEKKLYETDSRSITYWVQ